MSWWPWASVERRLIEETRRLRLGDEVRPGDVVKVVGTVRAEGPLLKAPLSGMKRCVWWSAHVEEAVLSSPIRLDETQVTPFAVVDGELRARVRSRALQPWRVHETAGESGAFGPPPPWVQALMKQHGLSAERSGLLFTWRSVEYEEKRFDEGNAVAVVGRVASVEATRGRADEDGAENYRQAPAEVTAATTIELKPLVEGWLAISLIP
jgi:hypothetical protein